MDYILKKNIVFVGMMGVGKSTLGRKLAKKLNVSFLDSDEEIEIAAGMSVSEIFNKFGENYFRNGEKRVMERLLNEGPGIIATGGGTFISNDIRNLILTNSFSVWIKADLETIWTRLSGKTNRPLLLVKDPKKKIKMLIENRYPIYKKANISIESPKNISHSSMTSKILES